MDSCASTSGRIHSVPTRKSLALHTVHFFSAARGDLFLMHDRLPHPCQVAFYNCKLPRTFAKILHVSAHFCVRTPPSTLTASAPTEMSCFFLYSASRRASLSAQASVTVYYLFELQSPHVNASTKFNSFRNRTDAERFVGVGLGGVLEHVTIEEISESTANKLKHGPPKQIDGGVLFGVDQTDYRQMHSTWQRILRMFQK